MTCTRTSTSDLSTGGTTFRKQKQADLTSMSPNAQTYPSWPKTTQWAVEAAGATKETATVVAMEEAVEATVVVVAAAALAIVVAVAAVEAVVEAAVATTMTTIVVVVAEAAGEAKAAMDGVAVIWEVVAGDLEAETTRSSSQQTSAMHHVVDAVATVEATIAATQAWRSALPLSTTTEVVVVEEVIAVIAVIAAAEVDLVTAVDGEAATATRRCTVSRLAAEANRSSKSHAATAKLFTLVI